MNLFELIEYNRIRKVINAYKRRLNDDTMVINFGNQYGYDGYSCGYKKSLGYFLLYTERNTVGCVMATHNKEEFIAHLLIHSLDYNYTQRFKDDSRDEIMDKLRKANIPEDIQNEVLKQCKV
jgi:hypothetical protein